MLKMILCTLGVVLFSGQASAASIDCTKARTYPEKMVCTDPEISRADDYLYALYSEAKMRTGNSDEFRTFVKANWKIMAACKTKECLQRWYKKSNSLYGEICAGSSPSMVIKLIKKDSSESSGKGSAAASALKDLERDLKVQTRKDVPSSPTSIMTACVCGDLDAVKKNLADGISPDTKDAQGRTCLMNAIIHKKFDVAKYLIEANANINLTDYDDCSALWHAADVGRLEIIKLLVSKGADVNAVGKNGKTPVFMTAVHGYVSFSTIV